MKFTLGHINVWGRLFGSYKERAWFSLQNIMLSITTDPTLNDTALLLIGSTLSSAQSGFGSVFNGLFGS